MPLLSIKHYHNDERQTSASHSHINPYAIEDCTVRDDDELTSSDEDFKNGNDSEPGDSSHWNKWFSRPKSSGEVGTVSDMATSKAPRARSVSPFRKGWGSLFKRGEENADGSDSEDAEREEDGDEDEDEDEDENRDGNRNRDEVLEKRNATEMHEDEDKFKSKENHKPANTEDEDEANCSNSSRFWRSWKLRHHRHQRPKTHESGYDLGSKPGSLVLLGLHETANLNYEDVMSKRREKNIAKLNQLDIGDYDDAESEAGHPDRRATYENDGGNDGSDNDNDACDEVSISSSFERATELKKRLAHLPDNKSKDEQEEKQPLCVPQETSPLTPLDDDDDDDNDERDKVQSLDTGETSAGVANYKNVYLFPKQEAQNAMEPGRTDLDKSSDVYANLLAALELLGGTSEHTDGAGGAGGALNKTTTLHELSERLLATAHDYSHMSKRLYSEKVELETKVNESVTCEEKEALFGQLEEKSCEVDTLTGELEMLKLKMHTSIQDLQERRLENSSLQRELDSNSKLLAKTQDELADAESRHAKELSSIAQAQKHLKRQVSAKNKELVETKKQLCLLKDDYDSLEAKFKNLEFDHQVARDQQDASREKLYELVRTVTAREADERQVKNTLSRLESDAGKDKAAVAFAKKANLKLQSDCLRERHKVLDLRKDNRFLRSHIDMISCHKNEAVQFMAQMMMAYRNILGEDVVRTCDGYLEVFSKNTFFNGTLANPDTAPNEQQLLQQAAREKKQVEAFYREFAKSKLLDQVVAKHISHMRSNNFLSQQLKGCRKQLQDNEEYIKRLLQDCKTQRTQLVLAEEKISKLKKIAHKYQKRYQELEAQAAG